MMKWHVGKNYYFLTFCQMFQLILGVDDEAGESLDTIFWGILLDKIKLFTFAISG